MHGGGHGQRLVDAAAAGPAAGVAQLDQHRELAARGDRAQGLVEQGHAGQAVGVGVALEARSPASSRPSHSMAGRVVSWLAISTRGTPKDRNTRAWAAVAADTAQAPAAS